MEENSTEKESSTHHTNSSGPLIIYIVGSFWHLFIYKNLYVPLYIGGFKAQGILFQLNLGWWYITFVHYDHPS